MKFRLWQKATQLWFWFGVEAVFRRSLLFVQHFEGISGLVETTVDVAVSSSAVSDTASRTCNVLSCSELYIGLLAATLSGA